MVIVDATPVREERKAGTFVAAPRDVPRGLPTPPRSGPLVTFALLRYLHAERFPHAAPDNGSCALPAYPVDLRPWAMAIDRFPLSLRFRRAPGGKPMRKGVIAVSEAAIGYSQLRAHDHATSRPLIILADWLLMRCAPGPDACRSTWYTAELGARYGMRSGAWPSARAQGQAISALLRAYLASYDERYLAAAHNAVGPMRIGVTEGGVAREVDGHAVLEAYPAAERIVPLAGWLYALVGLHDLYALTGDRPAGTLLTESLAALLELLPRYERGGRPLASLYERNGPDLATARELRLAALLFERLALVDPRLAGAACRWRGTARASSALAARCRRSA